MKLLRHTVCASHYLLTFFAISSLLFLHNSVYAIGAPTTTADYPVAGTSGNNYPLIGDASPELQIPARAPEIAPEDDITKSKKESEESDQDLENPEYVARKISAIHVLGNKYVTAQAILNNIPFKIGETFNPQKTSQLIKNLYNTLLRFRDITVYARNIGDNLIELYIVVQEKKLLKDVEFIGNKELSDKDIKSKIKFSEIPAIDKEELKKYALEIKKIYLEKGYHQTEIETDLQIEGDQAIAIFKITEHEKATVKRILFTGNKNVSAKELREIMFTREDWLLGFMDKSGSYHPERLEGDKQVIEQHYQNRGYLTAKVTDVDININPKTQNVTLTFEIKEGDIYCFNEIKAPIPQGETISEEWCLYQVPIRKGQYYSREAIVEAIKRLEQIWGNQGYIFANIEPSIQPDEDKKTVNVSFYVELGNKIFLNKITIKGNKKTHDKIIRRKLLLDEGELLTQFKMDVSKDRIESLGFFDARDGVNWKTVRVDENHADLDLMLKETKTGRFHMKLGFGGAGTDFRVPTSGISVGAELADTNLFGSGMSVNLEANWAKEETSFTFHLAQPWLFDRPISGAMDLYHKRPAYDEFRFAQPIYEKLTGGAFTAGVITRTQYWTDTQVLFSVGVDDVRYENKGFTPDENAQARANNVAVPLKTLLRDGTSEAAEYQIILNREFVASTYPWFANAFEQDERNHPMHTSRGYKWRLTNKFAFPCALSSKIGYYKFDLDGTWFTPLINEFDLVFKLHGHLGVITPLKNACIPFGELYNIGGPASVRGYLFGQIGPKFLGDPIGARKALFINAELLFPITQDFNLKGVFFYDGGAGWDNPNACVATPGRVSDNNFNYRHAIGLGIRMMNPMPLKIDWGFKLDPRKDRFNPKNSESTSEIHFGMSYDW